MGKFLGLTGLQHFWDRIKDYAKITTVNNQATITIGENSITPVPVTRTVNGHALNGDVTVTASDIGVESGAEVNQNAFSNIKVGNSTIAADAKQDTVEVIAGTDITITPDTTNDSFTVAVTNGVPSVTYSNNQFTITRGGSTTTVNASDIVSDGGGATAQDIQDAIAAAQVGAAMFQGFTDLSDDNSPSSGHWHFADLTDYKKGWYWVVQRAGTYAGKQCEVGDMIFCVTNYNSAYSANDFSAIQSNIEEMSTTDVDNAINAANQQNN